MKQTMTTILILIALCSALAALSSFADRPAHAEPFGPDHTQTVEAERNSLEGRNQAIYPARTQGPNQALHTHIWCVEAAVKVAVCPTPNLVGRIGD